MKWDMGGAGAVVGAMKALAGRKAKANVVGVCGLVENMPDGNAQRPGDVVTTMSGQTVEVINTDAEGRLVLCDAITWAQRTFKPEVDRRSRDADRRDGHHASAMNMPASSRTTRRSPAQLIKAAGASGDKLWRQPLARRLRQADRFADRRHEECRPARGRLDHRGAVPQALRRRRRRVGAPRHRRHGLVATRPADLRQGRDRLSACACSTSSSPTLSKPDRSGRRCGSISTSSAQRQPDERDRRDRRASCSTTSSGCWSSPRTKACSRGSTGSCGTRARPASCRTAWPAAPTTPRQPILLSTGADAPNLARNILIADGEWREAALAYDRAFYLFDEATLEGARLAWKLLAGRDGVERNYWAQEEGKWVKKGLSLALARSRRLGARPIPTPDIPEHPPWRLPAPFRSSSPTPPAAT